MIYFFTYGDDRYISSKQRIKQEALNCGYLDVVDVYGKEDLSADFVEKTSPYINMPIGGGYWIWKSFLLKKTFDKMQEGDYCIYVDCGCTVNPFGKERLDYYLSLIDKSESGIFRYSHIGTHEIWHTNTKVFEYFGRENDDDLKNSWILMAGVMIFKKNASSQKFVDRYLEIAENHAYLFSDHFNDYKKDPQNRFHRHDQSVSSCLVKLEVADPVIISDETYAPDQEGWMKLFHETKVPFLATRIRG